MIKMTLSLKYLKNWHWRSPDLNCFFASLRQKVRFSWSFSRHFGKSTQIWRMPLIEPKNSEQSKPENCRTCVDFKSWAKQQRKSLTTSEVRLPMDCEIFPTHGEVSLDF
jgi:hypothetical protein